MKLKIRYVLLNCLLVITLLTGCQPKKSDVSKDNESQFATIKMSDSNEYILGEDGCNTLLYMDCESMIVPSENGYYFIQNGMLCFYDKETNKVVYVCSKPNCKHEKCDENCDAYDATTPAQMYYYKNNLYVVESRFDTDMDISNYWLIKKSEDGSEQQDLFSFCQSISGEGIILTSYVHRGYFYYAVNSDDESKKETVTLYRRALEPDAKEEVVYETQGYAPSLYGFRAYGNDLYIRESGFAKANGEDMYSNIIKCNIHTKETKKTRENCYGNFVKIKDKMYIMDAEKNKIVQFSEDEEEEKEIYPIEDLEKSFITLFKTDGTYLYFYTEKEIEKDGKTERKRTLQIIDTEGNLVDTLKNTDEFIGGDDEYLFFKKYDDEYSEEVGQEVAMEHTYYYKKSDIGSGDYSLRTEMKPE